MHNELFQLGFPASELDDILQQLKERQMMAENAKEQLLRDYLIELGIIIPSTRNRWRLAESDRLEILLTQVQQQIQQQVIGRKENHPAIPRRLQSIHHKSASAWRGNSKAGLGLPLIKGQTVTHDDVLRLRSQGTEMQLTFACNNRENVLFADDESQWRSECCLPERMLLNLLSVDILSARLIMTVENLGAYVDMPLVDGLILIFAPGLNYLPCCRWISQYGQGIPWVHFPDLDPNGLSIARRISHSLTRPCRIWLPDFWPSAHQVNNMMGVGKHAWDTAPDCPQLTQLKQEQRWIEQEVLVVDYRFNAAIQRLIGNPMAETVTI
ncbi:hypothetical protein PEC302107_16280 [Pectobacterium araliae]|uniref:Wadjet protein JetD C-terminal domain-containing protein n=1 Tax=Pectobacterium araliae TaxID=3073862 RepID=A0AAN0MLM7_9GAMM|nr:hypothetical protein PEC302110_25250 [Pectobacterium sp. MAFF 302110]GKW19899.1 hypothetical protein PEC302107_16280 [Pectobacterium carotovorum subsp. carotovorum]